MKLYTFFAIIYVLKGIRAECPEPKNVPVVTPCFSWVCFEEDLSCQTVNCDGADYMVEKYTSAYLYEFGGDRPIDGCNGALFNTREGLDVSGCGTSGCGCGGPNGYYNLESLVLRPGCTFHGYEKCDYNSGNSGAAYDRFDGPIVVPKLPRKYGSFKTRCGLSYVDCIPSDSYTMVLRCDATAAVQEVTCSYTKSIGTSYSTSISETVSVDTTVEAYIEETLFGLFTTHLGVSVTTGYNWNEVTTEVMEVVETFQVTAPAPAGTVLIIEQAVGNCGNTKVHTELFKITHLDINGNLLDVRYEKEI